MEKIRYLPKGVFPPGFSVEEVGGRDNVDWLGDVVVNLLKSFRIRFFEECPCEGAGLLKKLPIGSTTLERMFSLESLGLCELSFAIVRQQVLGYRAVRR